MAWTYDNVKYGTQIDTIDIDKLFFRGAQPNLKKQIVSCDFETTVNPKQENFVYLWSMVWKDNDAINHPLYTKKSLQQFENRVRIQKWKEGTTIIFGTDIADFLEIINFPLARDAKQGEPNKARECIYYFLNGAKFDGTYIRRYLSQNWDLHQDLRVYQKYDLDKYYELMTEGYYAVGKKKKIEIDTLITLSETEPDKRDFYLRKISLIVNDYWLNRASFNKHSWTMLVKDNKFYEFKLKNATIWDALLMYSMSVKKMGETLNRIYKTNDYSKLVAENEYQQTELFDNIDEALGDANNLEYVAQDVFVVWKFLTTMREKIPYQLWKMTSASTAYTTCMDVFAEQQLNEMLKNETIVKTQKLDKKTHKMRDFYSVDGSKPVGSKKILRDIIINKYLPTDFVNEDEFIYFRHWYRGGLTFVNPMYQGKVINHFLGIDLNSSYSGVMTSEVLEAPYGKPVSVSEGSFHLMEVHITHRMINEKGLPFLTLGSGFTSADYTKYLEPGQVYYISTPEYERFKKYYHSVDKNYNDVDCYEREVKYSFKTKPMSFFFGKYVAHFYKDKAEASVSGDEAFKSASKLFLNSPYGKFGSKREVKIAYYQPGQWQAENEIKEVMDEGFYLPMGIAITAYARMSLVDAAGENYDKVANGDTDSLKWVQPHEMTSDEAISWLKEMSPNIEIDPYKCGAWKLEIVNYFGIFAKAKRYAYANYDDKLVQWVMAGYDLKRRDDDEVWNARINSLKMSQILTGLSQQQLRPNKRYGGVSLLEQYEKVLEPIWSYKPKVDDYLWVGDYQPMLNQQLTALDKIYGGIYE